MNNNNVIMVLKLGRYKALRYKECGKEYPTQKIDLCEDSFGPPELIYDNNSIQLGSVSFRKRLTNLWEYFELLPVDDKSKIVNLSTGYTPSHKTDIHSKTLELKDQFLKNEIIDPIYSFKERIFDSPINPKRFLNFYGNGENSSLMNYLFIPLSKTDELTFLPNATGG